MGVGRRLAVKKDGERESVCVCARVCVRVYA